MALEELFSCTVAVVHVVVLYVDMQICKIFIYFGILYCPILRATLKIREQLAIALMFGNASRHSP